LYDLPLAASANPRHSVSEFKRCVSERGAARRAQRSGSRSLPAAPR